MTETVKRTCKMEVLEKSVGFGYGLVNNNETTTTTTSLVRDKCSPVHLECFCALADYA